MWPAWPGIVAAFIFARARHLHCTMHEHPGGGGHRHRPSAAGAVGPAFGSQMQMRWTQHAAHHV